MENVKAATLFPRRIEFPSGTLLLAAIVTRARNQIVRRSLTADPWA
jgi:hypothetical protein